ncbi:MAG: hypothetical protein WCD37_00810 [Chloroflexia bacterium]
MDPSDIDPSGRLIQPDLHLRDIKFRWHLHDYFKWWWLMRPARVRILMYADGSVGFDGGSFEGLKHVVATLNTDPWYWVKFDITRAHRDLTPAQSNGDDGPKRLDQLNLNNFDEIWLFGLATGNSLTAAEITAVEQFMDRGGGVLVTGDHENLGKGISGALKRVGKLRMYPAPEAVKNVWNNTLQDANADGTYDFIEQSDAVPQPISWRRYPTWSFFPVWYKLRMRPHPVLCGPTGPIDVLPDHQHEGQVDIPTAFPTAEWPQTGSGFQPKPEVIAWGKMISPDSGRPNQEFPVIGAYDGHIASVGRIVADSTWHHWFDINLRGFPPASAALGQIEAYFLNVAVWLAPPAKQTEMRNALSWGAIWRDPLVMLNYKRSPIWDLGGFAEDALGQYAPHCTVTQWIYDGLPVIVKKRYFELLDRPDPPPIPLEQFVLGAAMRLLFERYQGDDGSPIPPKVPPKHEALSAIFEEAVPIALEELERHQQEISRSVQVLTRAAEQPDKEKKPKYKK